MSERSTSFGCRVGSNRPPTMGRRGMVCSSHYLASEAGLHLLRRGGNAVDAAIAVAATLGLVEPHMSGPGGDGYLMIHLASGETVCVNGTGRAPSRATLESYGGTIPFKGVRSASIPGLMSAWWSAHSAYGRLPAREVLSPALELAQDGFPVGHSLAAALAMEVESDSPLGHDPETRRIFAPDGRPLAPGELLRNPDYGRVLAEFAAGGTAFYAGQFGRGILLLSRDDDGCFEESDLNEPAGESEDPIRTTYRGLEVLEYPPGSSGHVLLQELNLVERFPLGDWGPFDPRTIHVGVEAKRLAFADREAFLADPASRKIPIDALISKQYAARRSGLISLERAMPPPAAGRPEAREDTTCFCVMDQEGNAVIGLQSIQSAFGAGVVIPGTGMLLNNRMTYWHLDPNHPNCLEPGKRVRHTMNPFLVLQNGRPVLLGGTPGADTQVQTNLQAITGFVDHGLNPQELVEAPRWRHLDVGTESEWPHGAIEELRLERRFPAGVAEALERLGHPVALIPDWAASGSLQLIAAHNGFLVGGADPRRDSAALGF